MMKELSLMIKTLILCVGGGKYLIINHIINRVDDKHSELKDYKFFCFNGTVKFFKVDFGRFIEHHANYYSPEGKLLKFGESCFKPNPNSDNLELLTLPSITYIDDVLPISQIDREQAKMFFITEDEGPVIMHYTKDENALYDMATLDPKFLQKIDAKIDDAEYNKGIFRTSADYEISIVNNNKLEGCKFYIPELNF